MLSKFQRTSMVNIPDLIDGYMAARTSLNEADVVEYVWDTVQFVDPLYGRDEKAKAELTRTVGNALTDRESAGKLRMVRDTSDDGRIYEIVE